MTSAKRSKFPILKHRGDTGHSVLKPSLRKPSLPGCSRTFLPFQKQYEAVPLYLCPAGPEEALPVEAKGPFHWPFPSPHLTSSCDLGTSCPSTGGTRKSARPPPPQANCRPYPWHSVRHSEGMKMGTVPLSLSCYNPNPQAGACLCSVCLGDGGGKRNI